MRVSSDVRRQLIFILTEQLEADPIESFAKYKVYLDANRDSFPRNAYELATSDWWHDFTDHKCPHDSWLEHFELNELSSGDRSEVRSTELKVTLLGAYHDLILKLRYEGVRSVQIDGANLVDGHGDWRYNEFRVSETGLLIHEIEWCSLVETSRWLIEANDIEFSAAPRHPAEQCAALAT